MCIRRTVSRWLRQDHQERNPKLVEVAHLSTKTISNTKPPTAAQAKRQASALCLSDHIMPVLLYKYCKWAIQKLPMGGSLADLNSPICFPQSPSHKLLVHSRPDTSIVVMAVSKPIIPEVDPEHANCWRLESYAMRIGSSPKKWKFLPSGPLL